MLGFFYRMTLKKILGSQSHWQLNKELVKVTGDLRVAFFLSYLIDCENYYGEAFFKIASDITEDTYFSTKLQSKFANELKSLGLIDTFLKGIPAKKHFLIKHDKVLSIFGLKQVSPIGQNLDIPEGKTMLAEKGNTNKNKVIRIDNKNTTIGGASKIKENKKKQVEYLIENLRLTLQETVNSGPIIGLIKKHGIDAVNMEISEALKSMPDDTKNKTGFVVARIKDQSYAKSLEAKKQKESAAQTKRKAAAQKIKDGGYAHLKGKPLMPEIN